nr:disintegrin and metalloproteinase domain-containing protein 9-like isoform X2 [Geotrypetes seraphini]
MRLLLLAGLRVTLLAILIPCAAYIPTSKFNSYKIWIPKKLEPRDGRQIEGYISYTINIEGKEHMVHLTPNRKVLSKDFTLFTYNSKGELIMEQPYIG